MYCSYCGTKHEDDATFCTECGAALLAPETPAKTVAQTGAQIPQQPINPQVTQVPQQPITPQQVPNQQIPSAAQNNAKQVTGAMVEVMVIGMIASALYALGVFLPYAKISVYFASTSISLIDGGLLSDAGIVLILALLGIGAAATPKRPTTILIIGILQLGFVFLKTNAVEVDYFTYGAGYYCLWIGAALTAITGLYGMIKRSQM